MGRWYISYLILAFIISSSLPTLCNTPCIGINSGSGSGGEVPFYIAFILHYHQPLYNETGSLVSLLENPDCPDWLDDVWIERTEIYRGLPAQAAIELSGNATIHVDLTGTLIEQLMELEETGWDGGRYIGWRDKWVEGFNTVNDAGYPKVSVLGTSYYHTVMPLVYRVDPRLIYRDIDMHRGIVEEVFNTSLDKGFFLIEESFTPEIIPYIVSMGFEWIVVDSEHLLRATKGYSSSYDPPPNPIDIVNPDPGDWEWGISPSLVFRPHVLEYNGSEIVAFIRYRQLSSWCMAGMDAEFFLEHLSHFQQYNNDPSRPFIAVIVHDGDNGFPKQNNGWDYYMGFLQDLDYLINNDPRYSFFRIIGLTQYLEQVYDPRNDSEWIYSKVHVEPGSWETMSTWGEPYFPQWNWPDPGSPDQGRWSYVVKAVNVLESVRETLSSGGFGESYWGRFYEAEDLVIRAMCGDYYYWDGDSWWDVKTYNVLDRALDILYGLIVDTGLNDTVPPTIMYAWRDPYNPTGEYNIYLHVYDYSDIDQLCVTVTIDNQRYTLTPSKVSSNLYKAHFYGLPPGYTRVYVYSMDTCGNSINTSIEEFILSASSPGGYVMDGVVDQCAKLVLANDNNSIVSMLWMNIRGDVLYVASNTSGQYDIFIIISLDPYTGYTEAPWAKQGLVANYTLYLAVESSNGWTGWFRPGDQLIDQPWANSAQGQVLEGCINLTEAIGYIPDKLYVAVAAYETWDNGVLVELLNTSNGDYNIDPGEYIIVYAEDIGGPQPIPEPTAPTTYLVIIIVAIILYIIIRLLRRRTI